MRGLREGKMEMERYGKGRKEGEMRDEGEFE